MKLKSFKRFLKEEEDTNGINSFIESVFKNDWTKTQEAFGNYIEQYSVHDGSTLYRIMFFPKTEMEQLTRLSDLKNKLKGILTVENQSHPRFYTKDDYNNIPHHLSFLAGIGEKIHGYTDNNSEVSYMGIIISKKGNTEDNVDFSNYNGTAGNKQIMDRIETTKPVLSVNSETVKIVAAFEFEEDGWTINPLDKSLEDDIGNDFEDKQEAPPEEGAEVTPTNQGQGEVKR